MAALRWDANSLAGLLSADRVRHGELPGKMRGYGMSSHADPTESNDRAQVENKKDPDADPVHRVGHSGMFPCFLRGFVSRLFSRERKAVISLARVWAGSITASM